MPKVGPVALPARTGVAARSVMDAGGVLSIVSEAAGPGTAPIGALSQSRTATAVTVMAPLAVAAGRPRGPR